MWDKVKYFKRDDFNPTSTVEPDEDLVRRLDNARALATSMAGVDVPFVITSAIRPLNPNLKKGQRGSSHATGHAVDIRVKNNRDRFYMLSALTMCGFTRVGIYNKHIHVDNSPVHDQEVCWTGISK